MFLGEGDYVSQQLSRVKNLGQLDVEGSLMGSPKRVGQ
jgi:hypothetical protein